VKQIKIGFIILIVLTVLIGCNTKEVNMNAPTPESTITSISIPTTPSPAAPLPTSTTMPSTSPSNEAEEKIDLTLFLYGPDDYENPIEKKVITVNKELYENNMAKALNEVFKEIEIRVNSVALDNKTKCITVDISEEVAMKFNVGSCAGILLTNELIDTLLNLPDIQSAIITVDGQKDYYADHFSFEGVFTKEENKE